jgi:hypothetical protein
VPLQAAQSAPNEMCLFHLAKATLFNPVGDNGGEAATHTAAKTLFVRRGGATRNRSTNGPCVEPRNRPLTIGI